MDCHAEDNVGTVGGGESLLAVNAVAGALGDLNLNNSTDSTKTALDKKKTKLRTQRRKEKLKKRKLIAAAAVAGVSNNSCGLIVGSATDGNVASNKSGSQKSQNVNGLSTKKQLNQNQTGTGNGAGSSSTAPVKDGPAKPKKARSKKSGPDSGSRKDYRKVVTVYQCGNEGCRKVWDSAHGWSRFSGLNCELCNGKAKVTNMIEGMIMVEDYRCTRKGCTNSWNMPHYPENVNPVCECDECGFFVLSGGVQERFGRHFWITCKHCGEEWEEVSMKGDYTQRCKKCNNPGTKKGTRTQTGSETSARRRGGGGVGHDIQGCDMCQKLIRDRVASSCIPKRRVVIQEVTENGVVLDRIIATE